MTGEPGAAVQKGDSSSDGGLLGLVRKEGLVEGASIMPDGELGVKEWVREACGACSYTGRSWSCPPGSGSLEEARERLSRHSRAVFLRFRYTGDRKALERAVLSIERRLRGAGFSRAFGFFVSPCTACPECAYPEECRRPERCRPTGESWGIDLMSASRGAGLPVERAREGEAFKPVALVLID